MALGGDSQDGHILNIALKVILPAVLHIINLSLKESKFAAKLKFHVVMLHYKQGSREDPDNYRPVCKLVELLNWLNWSHGTRSWITV